MSEPTDSQETKSVRYFDRVFGETLVGWHKRFPRLVTPSMLTLSRLLAMGPFFGFMAIDFLRPLALVPLVWIALCDIFDGVLARHGNLATRFGGFFDQAMDKGLILWLLWYFYFEYNVAPLDPSASLAHMHICALSIMLWVVTICDGINLLVRMAEAAVASLMNLASLYSYWFDVHTEKSDKQKDQVSSNAGKFKVWFLLIAVCFYATAWNLNAVSEAHKLMLVYLFLVTSICAGCGLLLIPSKFRLETGRGDVFMIAMFIVGLVFAYVPHAVWLWYFGDLLLVFGVACALWSTGYQLSRRVRQFRSS